MDSSVSLKDEICFLRVCHHISNAIYQHLICHAVLTAEPIPNSGKEDYAV